MVLPRALGVEFVDAVVGAVRVGSEARPLRADRAVGPEMGLLRVMP